MGCVLSERGWRVLENACAEKWRRNPERVQRRNRRKLNGGNQCTDQRHMSGMIAAARADQGHRATVLGSIGVRVNPLMQRWRNSQGERPEKRAQNSGGNDRARRYRLSPGQTKSHAREDCAFKRSGATQFRFHLHLDTAPTMPPALFGHALESESTRFRLAQTRLER